MSFDMFLVVALKILPLLLVIVLGYLAGWFKVFPKPDDAIDTLNRYALYFGFPILIFQGFCNPKMTLPPEAGFYLFHFLVAGLLVAGVAIASRMSPTLTPFRGNLVLGTLFGNVAYLGIPLSLQLLGPQLEGLTLLSVSLQVFLAMLLGPLFLLLWSPEQRSLSDVGKALLKQPLLWAPVLGFLARFLPETWMLSMAKPLNFFAVSAAPVALFLLGLHIWTHQSALKKLQWDVSFLVVGKLLIVPGLVLLVGSLFTSQGWMSMDAWRVTLCLSLMPTAITTFSIARDFRQNEGLMAQAILLTTLLSLLLLPFVTPTILKLTSP